MINNSQFTIPILYEDASIFIFNKPAGLAVQGGEGVVNSLDSLLEKHFSPRPLLIHRLDKDTSGVIVVAKNKEAAFRYSKIIEAKQTEKFYITVCVNGAALKDEGEIDGSVTIKGELKKAKTLYKKLIAHGDFAVLSIKLITGRMHQIRRHLSSIGCPVLGDDKYGDFKLNKKLKKEIGLKNLLLHAAKILIPNDSGKIITAEAELPEYFGRYGVRGSGFGF
jgi:23S rRNA pseudouridine955/2504/2580 synthase